MREWLTDEEREQNSKDALKVEVEAVIVSVLLIVSFASVIFGWASDAYSR
ncbi:hypothetical protein GCM10010990_36510 [Croceicoccus mobilis]|uniref:Uncharacterized protein n=1 Tax=Croceicoccus mobilis TaxID=1703339 RepID=A0A916Z9P2_9SPHN|nr:hypothetical protein GCM10010990_36510 [Croceicoccus mobilis]